MNVRSLKKFIILSILASSCASVSSLPAPKKKGVPTKKSATVAIEVATLVEYNKIIAGDKPVIVKLQADWCSACTATASDYEAVAKKYKDRVVFLKVNIDNKEFATLKEEHVTVGVPTTLYIRNGEVINTLAGGYPQKELEKEVELLLKPQEKEPKKVEKKIEKKVEKKAEKKEVAKPTKPAPKCPVNVADSYKDLETLEEYKTLLASKKPVFIVLSAEWCGACKIYDPVFAEAATKYADKAVFAKIDVDNKEFASLKDQYGKEGIPVTLFIKDGKVADSRPGAYPKGAFDTIVNNFITSGTTGLSTVQAEPQAKVQRPSAPVKKQTRRTRRTGS